MTHFKMSKIDALAAMARIGPLSNPRNTMPILGYTLFKATDGELTITGTDLEVFLSIKVPAEIYEAGVMTLPSKTFHDIAKSVAGQDITVKGGDRHQAFIQSGAYGTKLYGLSPDGYPTQPNPEHLEIATIDGSTLADAVNKTIMATSPGDDTYNLSGVYLFQEPRGVAATDASGDEGETLLGLAATDTQRMNIVTFKPESGRLLPGKGPIGVIVPPKGLQSLKAIAEGAGTVDVGCDLVRLVVKTPKATLNIRLLDGPFPDYKRVVPRPEDLDVDATLRRKDLMGAIKRLSNVMGSGAYGLATLTFSPSLLTIAAANPEIGASEETISADYAGKPFEVVYNPKHLQELFSPMRSEVVRYRSTTGRVSALITGPEDPGFDAVLVSASNMKAKTAAVRADLEADK